MRETMGWGAWVFDSAVRADRESLAVRYVVGWLFGHDAISSKQKEVRFELDRKNCCRGAVTV